MPMPTPVPLHLAHVAHPRSSVRDADLRASVFSDVNLAEATFENVALNGALFRNVGLRGAAISDADLVGATIDGILVSELLAAHAWWLRQSASASPADDGGPAA